MSAETRAAASSGLPHRKDIDGLRFFAIVPVVLYHAVGDYIPSGFIGVDVFFAISGYLIGGIIYRQSSANEFSFLNFYARRVRRIFPAILVVIIATVLAGLFLLDTEGMSLLAGSAQWTALGISNVFFFRYIDYFSPDASVNPLLMTWSLGIEEQFYIFFPIILLALRSLRRRYLLISLLVLIALSFAVSIFCAIAYPLAGFYLLPARAWEMGAGAALAVVHAEVPRERRCGSASDGLAAAGLAMVLVSCWLFSESTPFPGYAALLPVMGTILLLHTADSRINRGFLTARIFTGIGLVSYSWYLWHWPLMAFVQMSANGAPTLASMLLVAAFSLGLACVSWRFVEQPFRRGKLPPASVLWRFAAVTACLLLALQWIKHERAFNEYRLSPQARQIERVQQMSMQGEACMATFGDTALPDGPICAPPGATVALLGDSHATHLRFGLKHYVETRGSLLLEVTKASCAPLLGYSRQDDLSPNSLAECAEFQARAVDRIVRDPAIRTVVLASYLDRSDARSSYRINGKQFIPVSAEVGYGEGTRAMVSTLHKAGKHVVLVLDVPKYDRNIPQTMLTEAIPWRQRLGSLTSSSREPRSDIAATKSIRDIMKRSVRGIPDVTIIDLKDQLCEGVECRYSKDGVPLYIDDHHLSIIGSRRVQWGEFPLTH